MSIEFKSDFGIVPSILCYTLLLIGCFILVIPRRRDFPTGDITVHSVGLCVGLVIVFNLGTSGVTALPDWSSTSAPDVAAQMGVHSQDYPLVQNDGSDPTDVFVLDKLAYTETDSGSVLRVSFAHDGYSQQMDIPAEKLKIMSFTTGSSTMSLEFSAQVRFGPVSYDRPRFAEERTLCQPTLDNLVLTCEQDVVWHHDFEGFKAAYSMQDVVGMSLSRAVLMLDQTMYERLALTDS